MEITLNSNLIAIISIGIVLLIAIVAGHIAQVRRTGKLPTRAELHSTRDELREEQHSTRDELRVEQHSTRDELRAELHSTRDELREEMGAMREEFREEMRAMREEFREEMRAMREELHTAIRDSEARIIKALINHRHPEPAGPPVFIEPI